MAIVGGLDVHRNQITFDWVDHDTGESGRGRIAPATRQVFRSWLEALPGSQGALAVEAHRLAVRGRRTPAGRVRAASGRARRDQRCPREQAPRQDGQGGCSSPP